MSSLDETIQLLKDVINDGNCNRMNKSIVRGYLGELITIKKLRDEGYNPEHKGKLAGVDIVFEGILIDVKTSRLKKDGFEIKNWGWALARKGKPVKYAVAVCVALDEQSNNIGFYCIRGRDVEGKTASEFEYSKGQFTSVSRRFLKFQSSPTDKSSEKFKKAYEESENLLMNGKVVQVSPKGFLGKCILSLSR
jgi:hypothetical protein